MKAVWSLLSETIEFKLIILMMKTKIVTFFFFLSIKATLSQFDISLPVTISQGGMGTQISLQNKQVYVDIDLTEKYLQICCKPNRNIFSIIYSFLSNPFFQINEYTCPKNQVGFKESQVTLSSIGVIQMNHALLQKPQCSKGKLGLSKLSTFLNYLPINDQIIKIQINRRQGPSTYRSFVSFGQLQKKPIGSWTFSSQSQQLWDLEAKSIDLGSMDLDNSPKIVLVSTGQSIKIPYLFYEQLLAYYPSNQTCQTRDSKLICLCQSGIPIFFPKFSINLINGQKLIISPELYMRIDSNICRLLFEQSPDNFWYFNVGFFENAIFYFDKNRKQITIQKKQQKRNQSSQLIHLPIQLILNCAVVLLLCVFVSLVLIEIIKRIFSLPQARQSNVRQYMIQQNLVDS